MIKKIYYFYLMLLAAIYIAINVTVFLAVDYSAHLNNAQFWISWVFMFGLNSAVAAIIAIKTRNSHRNDIPYIPYAALGLFGGANVIYLVLGIVFTVFLPKWYVVLLVDLVIALFYLAFVFKFLISVAHIRSNDAYRRQKVAYIRTLSVTVKSYASLTSDYDLQQKIKRLASDFDYSDPISHDSLAQAEADIFAKVSALSAVVQSGDKAAAEGAINEISALLKMRNSQCALLK